VGSYKLLIKPSAAREIEDIPREGRLRIIKHIQGLASNPRPPGCEKLSAEDKYRVRQGRYRIVYAISDADLTVVVVKVGHRKEIYRRNT
jgi:mRNA interferase RelE/StbE